MLSQKCYHYFKNHKKVINKRICNKYWEKENLWQRVLRLYWKEKAFGRDGRKTNALISKEHHLRKYNKREENKRGLIS